MFKLSIITPTFNSAQYLQDTLRSIHRNPSLDYEHIVVDGGSTDGTLDILENWLREEDQLFVEPELNQYEAIQFGFTKANGDIFSWLNSDDIYAPWTISAVSSLFKDFPTVNWITGLPSFIDVNGIPLLSADRAAVYPQDWIKNGWYRSDGLGYLMQENMFWKRDLWEKVGGFNPNYKYAGDYDLWIRFSEYSDLVSVNMPFSFFRTHETNRSKQGTSYRDEVSERCSHLRRLPVWFSLGNQNKVINQLLRMMSLGRGGVIYRSYKSGRFRLKESRGSAGRYSLNNLIKQR